MKNNEELLKLVNESKRLLEESNSRIEALEKKLKLFEVASTIPFEVDKAFSARLKNTFASGGITTSAKSTTSEAIPVNSGAATNVQIFPDIFLQTTIGGVTYFIAAYT